MTIVIDIPEHIYEHAKETTEDSRDEFDAMRAIANGSPLSKVHGDLIAEKERLIKKDIESIENRVRHAFNQGYEMGLKASRSEILNTCGDAISRQAVLDAFWKLDVELSPTTIWTIQNMIKDVPSVTPEPCEDAISRQEALNAITMAEVRWQAVDNVNKLPSVSPQPKVGRWIPTGYDGYADGNPVYDWWECSECGWEHTGDEESLTAFCPNCGTRMEVEHDKE